MEVARDLFELWLTQSSYHELVGLQEDGLRLRCRATSLNHPLIRLGELEAENGEARQSVIALLAQAPLNQWISFPAFARFIYRLHPLFLQKRQRLFSLPHWWLEQEEGRPLRPLVLNDWLRGEYYYLAHLLRGPLHWWGVSDVALDRDGQLLAFRLTDVAGWFFNGIAVDEERMQQIPGMSVSSIKVIEDNAVLVKSAADSWPMIQLLEDFTEPAGVRDSQLCYRIAPKSLAEAMSRGHQPTRLLEMLRSIEGRDLTADNALAHILAQLERWTMSYGRVRIYTDVSMLETADAAVVRELSATTALEEHTVQTIRPNLLILKKAGAERIIEDLKRRGQAPLLHDEEFYGAE